MNTMLYTQLCGKYSTAGSLEKALIFVVVCLCPWCKYFHHGPVLSYQGNYMWSWEEMCISAFRSQHEQTVAHHWWYPFREWRRPGGNPGPKENAYFSQVQLGKPSNFTDIPLIFHIQNVVKNNLLHKNILRSRCNSCSIMFFPVVLQLDP